MPERVEKRIYVRAKLDTRVRVQPVSRDEFTQQTSTPPEALPAPLSSPGFEQLESGMAYLLQRLCSIEEKLDRLLEKAASDEEEGLGAVSHGTARDVSGAGLKLTLDEQFEVGQPVLVSLSIPGFSIGPLDAYGEIVRVTPMEISGQPVFETSLKFVSINENERETLIAYSFQRQRQTIRDSANVTKQRD